MNQSGHRSSHPVERAIAIHFDGVSFSYGPVKVLEHASFHLHQGEFIALVGPNGSGKTTVLKLLLGLEKPTAGKIEIFGRSSEAGDRRQPDNRDRIGYVPQQALQDRVFPITVRDVVRMGTIHSGRGYGRGREDAIADALEQADILDLTERPFGALSGGQRRRVLVARALASRPDILILDEPTANMDKESGERLFATLGKLKGKATILIVTHDMDFVSSLTDRVLCLGDEEEGRNYGIVQHPTEEAAHGSRIIHSDSIAADDCYEDNASSKDALNREQKL